MVAFGGIEIVTDEQVPEDQIWIRSGDRIVAKVTNVSFHGDGCWTVELPANDLTRKLQKATMDGLSIAEPADPPELCPERPPDLSGIVVPGWMLGRPKDEHDAWLLALNGFKPLPGWPPGPDAE